MSNFDECVHIKLKYLRSLQKNIYQYIVVVYMIIGYKCTLTPSLLFLCNSCHIYFSTYSYFKFN